MGRHRRSTREPLPAWASTGRHKAPRRKAPPVRTGLLGASAAMAFGAVAMASGLLPGGGSTFDLAPGTGSGDPGQAAGLPEPQPQGRSSTAPAGGRSPSAGADTRPPHSPSALPSHRSATPSAPSSVPAQGQGTPRPSRTEGRPAPQPSAPATTAPDTPADTETAARDRLLALVNHERRKAGCDPVTADAELSGLAEDFSEDMAERGFFGHVDPEGTTPWERAAERGIDGLAAENIARGQRSPAQVMKTWMSSPGHRANILNCDYTTMGIGVHFGDGGPWWTEDFGF